MIPGAATAVVAGSRRDPLPVVGDRPRDESDRFIDVERFRQVLVRAALVGGHRAVEIGIAGHDDHREVRIVSLDLAEQLQSIHVGHADVGDDRVGLALAESCVDAGSDFEPLDRESGATERALQYPPDGPVGRR